MNVFEGVAYMSNFRTSKVAMVDVYSSREEVLHEIHLSHPASIAVSHALRQPGGAGANLCSHKPCMYLCVLTPTRPQCVCPEGKATVTNPYCEGELVIKHTSALTTVPTTKKTAARPPLPSRAAPNTPSTFRKSASTSTAST